MCRRLHPLLRKPVFAVCSVVSGRERTKPSQRKPRIRARRFVCFGSFFSSARFAAAWPRQRGFYALLCTSTYPYCLLLVLKGGACVPSSFARPSPASAQRTCPPDIHCSCGKKGLRHRDPNQDRGGQAVAVAGFEPRGSQGESTNAPRWDAVSTRVVYALLEAKKKNKAGSWYSAISVL